jgi:hypothetical protein
MSMTFKEDCKETNHVEDHDLSWRSLCQVGELGFLILFELKL